MEILFLILKIIGILLAVLILLVVALIAVPVRYGADLKAQDELEGKAVFSWMLHLVDFRIWYEKKEVSYRLRILGIPLSLDRQKKQKPVKAEKKRKKNSSPKQKKKEDPENISKKKVNAQNENRFLDYQEEKGLKIPQNENRLPDYPEEKFSSGDPEQFQEKNTAEKIQSGKEAQLSDKCAEERRKQGSHAPFRKKKSLRRALQNLFGKIKNFFQNIGNIFQKLRQRIKDIKNGTTTLKEQIANIKKLLSEETNKSALRHLLEELKYLLRHYLPRKASGNLNFGMEDPARTGQLLGLLSVLPFWTRYKIRIEPDFAAESFYIRGTLRMKGHIRAWHMLVSGFRLIKDKNIRTLITKMRK